MKKKIFAFVLAFMFILPCALLLTACGKKGGTWHGPVSYVDPDVATNYWVEYEGSADTSHSLWTLAKITKDGTSYYFARYFGNDNIREAIFKVEANGSYQAYYWNDSTWLLTHSGSSWYDYKSGAAHDQSYHFGTVMNILAKTGDVNSFIRHENGTDVKNMGITPWQTAGYTNGTHHVEAEYIEDCLHFYDEQKDEHYYFAPETHFLLSWNNSWSGASTKVYKRVFDLNYVLQVHDISPATLPFDLPAVSAT